MDWADSDLVNRIAGQLPERIVAADIIFRNGTQSASREQFGSWDRMPHRLQPGVAFRLDSALFKQLTFSPIGLGQSGCDGTI